MVYNWFETEVRMNAFQDTIKETGRAIFQLKETEPPAVTGNTKQREFTPEINT